MHKKNITGALSCPVPFGNHDTVQAGHGSGGRMMGDLLNRLFLPVFDNPALAERNDQALLESPGRRLAFSTDAFVVDPLFFPGGNIGDLAVNGTVNDLCMSGARPLWLSAAFILEEGFALPELEKIVSTMRTAADRAGVQIVTGDTKVVPRGKGDKVFITTSGIGIIEHNYAIGVRHIRPGDAVIVSGTLGDHGLAVLSKREGLEFDLPVISDTASLNGLVAELMAAAGGHIHAMRDATRGGLAAVLNEFAETAAVSITVEEQAIPVKAAVSGACSILGLDPLYVANEGKMVIIADAAGSDMVLNIMGDHPLGHDAALIGQVTDNHPGRVVIKTVTGSSRILDMPAAEHLPRIC